MQEYLILLAIGLPWLGAVLVWTAGNGRPRWQHGLAVASSVAAACATLALIPNMSAGVALRLPLGGVLGDFTFVADALAVSLANVATIIGGLAVIFSVSYMAGEAQLGRYYAMVLLFIGAMVGLVLSSGLLLLFFFWEITALCSYALISFHNDDPAAVAGGIKALLITQLGGVGLLLGALAARAYFGDDQIESVLRATATLPATAQALLAFGFLVAAMAKSAQAPFHTWLPDAMEAPTPVSALIHAATMVNAGVYLLLRFFPAFAAVPGWRDAIVVVGVITALLAALMALVATDLKRVLAYSTVSQLGYMVYAIGAGAIFAGEFHLVNHAVFKALLFLGAGAIIHSLGTRDMREMGNMRREMPFTAATFITGAAALAGLPLLNGFWSKELILEAGQAAGPQWAYWLMLLGAGVTALYTARMVWLVFLAPAGDRARAHRAASPMRLSLGVLAVGAWLSWLLAGPLSALLAETLPYHDLHVLSTLHLIEEVLSHPATYLALAVVALGLVAWLARERLKPLTARLSWLARAARAGFGFEALNSSVVWLVRGSAVTIQPLQTGQLNWNIAGIVAGLIVVLIALALGG
ncbi:MAG: NADH-quinone oxidoreductase subunit L [Anaerolineae bacterium]|nr:NADH-quinone oxidoreductase subunit L [Anaerolineae bacterium]